jgi:hypothetical protein
MMHRLSFLLCAFPLLAATSLRADDPRRFSTDPATGTVTLSVDGKTCWAYTPQSPEGKPYFHPLAIPGTGEAFTSYRPPDHAWHLGFWFSWKYINDCNFWEPDTNGVTRVLSQTAEPGTDGVFRIHAVLAYYAKGREVVRETRAVAVTTQTNGNYVIDWDAAFTAQSSEAVFSCTPAKRDKNGEWASGGYAGLALRMADSPGFTYAYANADGLTNVKTCGEKSGWLSVVATSSATGAKARITLRDNPENPRHPTPWFARHSATAQKGRGYYFVGPSMIFHEPLRLAPGDTLRFRYSVSVERL